VVKSRSRILPQESDTTTLFVSGERRPPGKTRRGPELLPCGNPPKGEVGPGGPKQGAVGEKPPISESRILAGPPEEVHVFTRRNTAQPDSVPIRRLPRFCHLD